jgi:phosphatidylserine/phosphatidylglycerophosphate/cardiolipin synthase-like enzyme
MKKESYGSFFIDDRHAIAHNKIMIFERETVITGSFNFTKAAEEKNKENKHGF